MPVRRAYTLIELLATLAIVGLALLLTIPALQLLNGGRKPNYGRQNMTQVRGLQSALVLYASGNNSYYVGLDSRGEIVEPTVEGRFQEFLDEGYFVGEYIIAPPEWDTKKVWTTGPVTAANYSYAFLDIAEAGQRTDRATNEWRDTLNAEAVVVSDRNTGSPVSPHYRSVWATDFGDWQGAVAWNDNHVTFEHTATGLSTKYGQHANSNDDLFQADTGNDAFMIHTGE